MQNWNTARELAGIDGMPRTERAIQIKSARENWPSRKRAGSKAMEYPFSCLPEATQAALLKKAVAQVTGAFSQTPADKQGQALAVLVAATAAGSHAAQGIELSASSTDGVTQGARSHAGTGRRALADRPAPPGAFPEAGHALDKKRSGRPIALRQSANDALSQRQQLARDARLLVVNGLTRMMQTQRLSVRAACQQLCDWVQAGEVDEQVLTALALGHSKSGLEWAIKVNQHGQPVACALAGQDVVAKAKTVSRRTLERWVAAAKDGHSALAPQVRRKDMSIAPWMPLLLSRMNRPQKPTLKAAYREACQLAPPHGISLPGYDAVLR